jgi:acetyltransferase
MAGGRRELILGLKRERGVGVAVVLGLGGVFSEALRDIAIRVAPLTRLDAEEMAEELRGRAILAGLRGLGPARPGMLTELLLGLSGLAERHADRIEELDVNPLILADDGASCAAVDVLVRWRDPEP